MSTTRDLSYHIETWGCQMNVHDSEQLADSLQRCGYRRAPGAESATVIVLNTCSVREKAAQKVFTRLGRLAELKHRPAGGGDGPTISLPLLCVAGCVAQQEGEEMVGRVPSVDLVIGTRRTAEIGDLLERILNGEGPLISTDLESAEREEVEPIHRLSPWKAYVTIIEGCDNFCAYCIVPLVRGRELSRGRDEILGEIRRLVTGGVREVELLGQNVNSYRDPDGCDFTSLLEAVASIEGLIRLRFTVSHPRDFTPGLARLMSERQDVICRHLHLPLQAGSDATLRAMGRGYTRQEYLAKITHLKSLIPDIAISTDLIVGFPGESEDDFRETLSAMRIVRYDATFSFMYNPRPGTRAALLDDDVPVEVKHRRLTELQTLQKTIQLERHEELVGRELEVLVEGESRRGGGQFFGRDSGNRVVNFDLPLSGDPRGRLVMVRVEKAHPNSFSGIVTEAADRP